MNSIDEVVSHINLSLNESQQLLPSLLSWEVPWIIDSESNLHYSELSEDFIPLSATPLLRLHISSDFVKSSIKKVDNGEHIRLDSTKDCFIEYYDNTVAILHISVEVTFTKDDNTGFHFLDKWSTALCARVIDKVFAYERLIEKSLVSKNRGKREIFLKPESFRVFFDEGNQKNYKTDTLTKMLWVTRIYIKDERKTNIALLERWTQQSDLDSKVKLIGSSKIAFCIGNSVIFSKVTDKEYSALISSMSICTYFYVLHDVINKNLKSVFVSLSSKQTISMTDISRVNKIRSHVEFIESEFSDVLLGLQGLRSNVATHLLDIWKYYDLVNSVKHRKETVGKMVDYLLQEKQGRYARVVEAILAAIGGVAILDFALNLFSFANNSEIQQDSIPGLLDMAKKLPPDGVLYAIIAILLGILFLVIRKK